MPHDPCFYRGHGASHIIFSSWFEMAFSCIRLREAQSRIGSSSVPAPNITPHCGALFRGRRERSGFYLINLIMASRPNSCSMQSNMCKPAQLHITGPSTHTFCFAGSVPKCEDKEDAAISRPPKQPQLGIQMHKRAGEMHAPMGIDEKFFSG